MKKNFLVGVAVLAMACASSAGACVLRVAVKAEWLIVGVWRWAVSKGAALARKVREQIASWQQPSAVLRAAGQYFKRQDMRARAQVFARWRMVPSV